MTRVLIMLTNVFPFATGEEFVEAELPHLAAAFDRVVVVATKTRPGVEITRAVPANVEVIRAGRDLPTDRRGRLLQAAKGLPRLRPGNIREAERHLRRLGLDASYASLAAGTVRDLRRQLEQHWHDWQLDTARTTVYSYWLHTPALAAGAIARWLRGRGAQVDGVLSRAHSYDIYRHAHRDHYVPQRAATLAGVDRIHVISENGRAAILADNPEVADKLVVSHLATPDPGPVVPPSRHPFHVVTCAFVSPIKRLDRLPGILAILRRRGIDARWTHIGPGPQLPELERLASDLLGTTDGGTHPVATFVGYVPNSQLVETYRQLRPTVLLSLSVREGLPVTLMEGASLGIAVVATDVGGVGEIVHPDTGVLLPAEFTDEGVADELARLAELPDEQFAALGRRSRQIWDEGFNEATVYPAFVHDLLTLGERKPR
ncbi:glycosyltransferase [Aestuariimicrobium kwangyangense]|uniref:glycosyltransferase n=1 Tax=Aestuariimicrobium kwangyangense TaxID=396389 RepID=UPI0003B52F8D|nr:glycosyltransferase [Aestuariimicrobium kwangyangense]